jgi:hypothetical protein
VIFIDDILSQVVGTTRYVLSDLFVVPILKYTPIATIPNRRVKGLKAPSFIPVQLGTGAFDAKDILSREALSLYRLQSIDGSKRHAIMPSIPKAAARKSLERETPEDL